MGVFSKAFIFLFISYLLVIPSSTSLSGRELIGVVPFVNQRSNQANDWIGFYIQARLQAYLEDSLPAADFYPLDTLRLWQYKSDNYSSISKGNSVLITGSFQQVLNLGVVKIRLQWFTPAEQVKEFSVRYKEEKFEQELDTLFGQISEWIDPKSTLLKQFSYPSFKSERIKTIFSYRQMLYSPGQFSDIKYTLHVGELINEKSRAEYIADLAEGKLILTSNLLLKEQKPLLQEIEQLLRAAAMKHVKNSRIHSLLAEVYYLSHKNPEWVLKTASESLKLNPQNSLALLMQILAMEIPDSDTKSYVDKMFRINPWIWPAREGDREKVQFQHGIFRTELTRLAENARRRTPITK